jgi:hypothetical protein
MHLVTFLQPTRELHRLWYPNHNAPPDMLNVRCSVCNVGSEWLISSARNDGEFSCCRAHSGARDRVEADERICRQEVIDEYTQFVARRRGHVQLLLYRLRLTHA